jgi:hypothetical protein
VGASPPGWDGTRERGRTPKEYRHVREVGHDRIEGPDAIQHATRPEIFDTPHKPRENGTGNARISSYFTSWRSDHEAVLEFLGRGPARGRRGDGPDARPGPSVPPEPRPVVRSGRYVDPTGRPVMSGKRGGASHKPPRLYPNANVPKLSEAGGGRGGVGGGRGGGRSRGGGRANGRRQAGLSTGVTRGPQPDQRLREPRR